MARTRPFVLLSRTLAPSRIPCICTVSRLLQSFNLHSTVTDTLDTGHNIQILAEGKCGDIGTIFRDAAGGVGGPGGPPSGAGQSSTPAASQADLPTDPTADLPAGLLSSVLPRQAEALDLLTDNSAIMGGGVAGETLEHFGTCWDGKVTNPSNPARRDVAQLQSGSYIVLQWNQDNPGLWVSFSTLQSCLDYLTDVSGSHFTATSHGT